MQSVSRRLASVVAAFGLALLAACNLQNLQAPGLNPQKEQAVRAVFTAMQKGDLSAVPMGPEMQTPEARAALPQIFAAIPKGAPSRVRLVSWKSNVNGLTGARTETLQTSHEYTFPAGVFTAETVMSRDFPASGPGGPWTLRGFHIARSATTYRREPGGAPAPNTRAAAPNATASAPAAPAQTPQPLAQTGSSGNAGGSEAATGGKDDDGPFANWEAPQDEIQKPH
jgi:hypothetical protein